MPKTKLFVYLRNLSSPTAHRDLGEDVLAGRFREDLFHRVAVAVLKIFALRERGCDLSLLVDHHMREINRESKGSWAKWRRNFPQAQGTVCFSTPPQGMCES